MNIMKSMQTKTDTHKHGLATCSVSVFADQPWIHDLEGGGEPDEVIRVLLRCRQTLKAWGYDYYYLSVSPDQVDWLKRLTDHGVTIVQIVAKGGIS